MTTYREIDLEVEDGVATITFNRPDQLNALTLRMKEELRDAFDRTEADDEVRAIILTGNGRAFCAGADQSPEALEENVDALRDWESERGYENSAAAVTMRMFRSRKPIIAAINGAAVGFGATVILAADVRLASETARIGYVFPRRGATLEAGSSWFLPRIVGLSKALEWVQTGRIFDAEEALGSGLVRSIHTSETLLATALDLAREIAQNTAPVAVALNRQLVLSMMGAHHPMEAVRIENRLIGGFIAGSPDHQEGIASFFERRTPAFPMRASTDLPPFYPWWNDPQFLDQQTSR